MYSLFMMSVTLTLAVFLLFCYIFSLYIVHERIYRQVSFYARDLFLKNTAHIEHRIKTVYFLGVRGLTTSSYIVYEYTTIGHTDL